MNTRFLNIGIFACFALSLGSTHAAQTLSFTASVNNNKESDIALIGADWPLGNRTPADYSIPADSAASFGLTLDNATRGQITFIYGAADQACKFSAGHGVKESFGWFKPVKTPYQWANAKSEGRFLATCKAKIVNNTPGKGYSAEFTME